MDVQSLLPFFYSKFCLKQCAIALKKNKLLHDDERFVAYECGICVAKKFHIVTFKWQYDFILEYGLNPSVHFWRIPEDKLKTNTSIYPVYAIYISICFLFLFRNSPKMNAWESFNCGQIVIKNDSSKWLMHWIKNCSSINGDNFSEVLSKKTHWKFKYVNDKVITERINKMLAKIELNNNNNFIQNSCRKSKCWMTYNSSIDKKFIGNSS